MERGQDEGGEKTVIIVVTPGVPWNQIVERRD